MIGIWMLGSLLFYHPWWWWAMGSFLSCFVALRKKRKTDETLLITHSTQPFNPPSYHSPQPSNPPPYHSPVNRIAVIGWRVGRLGAVNSEFLKLFLDNILDLGSGSSSMAENPGLDSTAEDSHASLTGKMSESWETRDYPTSSSAQSGKWHATLTREMLNYFYRRQWNVSVRGYPYDTGVLEGDDRVHRTQELRRFVLKAEPHTSVLHAVRTQS